MEESGGERRRSSGQPRSGRPAREADVLFQRVGGPRAADRPRTDAPSGRTGTAPKWQPSQVAGGMELAQAIGTLARQLSGPLLEAQLAGTGLWVEPVELTLQVVAFRAGEPGQSGIEWRVMSPRDQAPSNASAVHSLKMRFSARSSKQDPTQDVMERRTDPPRPESGHPPADHAPGHTRQAEQAHTGTLPHDHMVAAPASGHNPVRYAPGQVSAPGPEPWQEVIAGSESQGRPGSPDVEGRESGAVTGAGAVTVVRVRCYHLAESRGPDAERSQPDAGVPQREHLVIEQEFATVPRNQAGELDVFLPMPDEAHQRQDERDRLIGAAAEYVAERVDNVAFSPVRTQWKSRDFFTSDAAADVLDRSRQWLQSLVAGPLENAGAAPPVADIAGGIGAEFVIVPVARPLQAASLVLDIAGIAFGATMGIHTLVVERVHHLGRTLFHEAVVRGINDLLPVKRDGHGAPARGREEWAARVPPGRAPPSLGRGTRSGRADRSRGIDGPGRGFGVR
jgi:hypothetical protein